MQSGVNKVYIAGHRGMVGSAIVRALAKLDGVEIVTRTREQLDLTDQSSVRSFFEVEKPTEVYLAAAKVGGIYANNTFPAEFIYQNLLIQANVIEAAFRNGVKKLLFLGSSCIYPRLAPQPMAEDALLSGPLESTNEPYAIAKIAGIKLCESFNRQYGDSHGVDYRSVMPTNLYGPGDNYHPENSHVIPALIRRFHEAKLRGDEQVSIWGSGAPRREFLYVDDMAVASIHVMSLDQKAYQMNVQPMLSHINVGCGDDITIKELAAAVSATIGYRGEIVYDASKPDGPPRKLMDSRRINSLGWQPKIGLIEGLGLAYQDFLHSSSLKG